MSAHWWALSLPRYPFRVVKRSSLRAPSTSTDLVYDVARLFARWWAFFFFFFSVYEKRTHSQLSRNPRRRCLLLQQSGLCARRESRAVILGPAHLLSLLWLSRQEKQRHRGRALGNSSQWHTRALFFFLILLQQPTDSVRDNESSSPSLTGQLKDLPWFSRRRCFFKTNSLPHSFFFYFFFVATRTAQGSRVNLG